MVGDGRSEDEKPLRARIPASIGSRGRRFARDAVLPDVDRKVAELAHAVEGDPSFSARLVPLPTDDDTYWTVPAVERRGFDPEVLPPEALRRVGQDFLSGGRQNVASMVEILARHGCDVRAADGILDFGCGVGRMIRWLAEEAEAQPVWGVDIEVPAIRWAQQHLSPPFNFSTCTTLPHLPFEDRTFGLVYAGSVFSHIEDLADAWLLELRRITRPGGHLYLTVHVQTTIKDWMTNVPHDQMSGRIRERPDLFEHLGTEHAAIGHRAGGNVFYDLAYVDWLCSQWFDVVAIAQKAWFNQTAMVLRRPLLDGARGAADGRT